MPGPYVYFRFLRTRDSRRAIVLPPRRRRASASCSYRRPRPVDRHHSLQLIKVAQRRSPARRTLRRRGGIGRPAQRVLDGDDGRWRLQDQRRRASPGRRPPTSISAAPSARSRSPNRIPTSCTSGGGEFAIRGNTSHGDGVYKTTDAGKTWTYLGLVETRHISKIRVHPRNPDLVYVAALGQVWGPIVRARDLQVERRRRDLEEGAVPQRFHRRGRSHHGSERPQHALRRVLAGRPHALEAGERRRGQRHLQDDRRRATPGRKSPGTPGFRRA